MLFHDPPLSVLTCHWYEGLPEATTENEVPAPEQMVTFDGWPVIHAGSTVTVAVLVCWTLQPVVAFVASTLYVVVELGLTAAKLIADPVPATAEPTGVVTI